MSIEAIMTKFYKNMRNFEYLRIIEAVHAYFKVSNQNVCQACGYALRQVYLNCLLRESVENKALLLYEPLAVMLSGGTDRVSQNSASLCLCDLLLAILEAKDFELMENIRSKYLYTFLKINYELPGVLKALGIILKSTDIRLNGSMLHKLIERLLKYTQTTSTAYMIKVEVSIVLNVLANKLLGVAESFIGTLHEEVIASLRNLSKDRVIKVQNAANEALKAWMNLKNELENLEAKKMTRDIIEQDPDKLIKLRTGIDINQREDIGRLMENLETPGSASNQVRYDEVTAANVYLEEKNNKILKKKSGTGGGFVVLEKDKRPASATFTTENKKKQNIKELIQKSIEGGTTRDKFEMNVRFPGQDYVGEYSNSRQEVQPQRFSSSHHARSASGDRDDRMDMSKETLNRARRERQIELTQQLLALQSQGYIKNIPTDELLDSIENSDNEPRLIGSNFPRSVVGSQVNRESQMTSYVSKDVGTFKDTQDLRQYDLTNAFSQNLNTLPSLPKDSNLRSQKEYIIRSKMQGPVGAGQTRTSQGSQQSIVEKTISQDFKHLGEGFDLEDTIPYDFESYNAKEAGTATRQGEALMRVWDQTLKDLERNDVESAYQRILDAGDDIYLMRLMSKTGPCLEQLNRKTALAVTNRIAKLENANFMEKVFLEVMQEGFDLQLTDQLTIEDQNQLLEELYSLSALENQSGKKATNLYSILLTSINK